MLLSRDGRYRHRHAQIAGRIRQGEEWTLVTRYHTAHGFAHRDLLSSRKNVVKIPLGVKDLIGVKDLNMALAFAESDLKATWR